MTRPADAVVAVAKVLATRVANDCNVDAEDMWKTYSENYLADAEAVLEALASVNAADGRAVAPPAIDLSTLREGLMKLAKFGAAALAAHRNDGYPGDVDGGTLQELCESSGVIEPRTVTEPCSEGCACAEWDEFPQTCYFVPDDVKAARAALAGPTPQAGATAETAPKESA